MRLFGLQDGSGDYDVSPDGATIVFSAQASPEPYRTLNYDLFSVPTAGGDVKNLTADNPASDTGPVFSPDGTRIAYGREVKANGWPDYTRLAVMDVRSGATRMLTDGWDNSAGNWQWTADGETLLFVAEVRARINLLCDWRDGRRATRAASRRRAGRRGGHAHRRRRLPAALRGRATGAGGREIRWLGLPLSHVASTRT